MFVLRVDVCFICDFSPFLDDLSSSNIKRRSHIRRKNKAELVPHPQPKPRDSMTSNSPNGNNTTTGITTTGTTTTQGPLQQLHVSEGSDSDVVTTTNESSHTESECRELETSLNCQEQLQPGVLVPIYHFHC